MGTNKYLRAGADGTTFILLLAAIALLALSFVYAFQRVIFTDTAVYAFYLVHSGKYFIATNRFISVFSQVLPLIGIGLGCSLKTLIYLYSLNCILIPIGAAAFCHFVFKNTGTALSIILFYSIMNVWIFYYPVTEFQMGLCFLMVYHAFITWYFKRDKAKPWLFYLVSLPAVVTITFSHPLSIYVLFAWMAWLLIDNARARKWLLLFPTAISLLSYIIRERFFKTYVGTVVYDDSKREGLKNFKAPISSYFNSNLSKTSWHALSGDYFLLLVLVALITAFFIWKKKWLSGLFFVSVVVGFWLLVTVSFRDLAYDHYPEHLYQPIPFFIALIFGQYALEIIRQKQVRMAFLALLFGISFSKIAGNNKYYTRRLEWYEHYIAIMHRLHAHNGALSPLHIEFGTTDSYWASVSESYLVSAMAGPDSSVRLILNFDPATLKDWEPDPTEKTKYFLRSADPHILLDSIMPRLDLEYKGEGSRFRLKNP